MRTYWFCVFHSVFAVKHTIDLTVLVKLFWKYRIRDKFQMNELPLELMDLILQKSYLCFVTIENRFKRCSIKENLFRKMASVDYCWFQRLRKRRFKTRIWRHLTGLCKYKMWCRLVYCTWLSSWIRLYWGVSQLWSHWDKIWQSCQQGSQTSQMWPRRRPDYVGNIS